MEDERYWVIRFIKETESSLRRNREYYNKLVDYQIDLPNEDRKYRINKLAKFLREYKLELKRLHQELAKIDSIL